MTEREKLAQGCPERDCQVSGICRYGPVGVCRSQFAPRAALSAMPDRQAERDAIVAWLRQQSDIGADLGNECAKGTTMRAAYGGGSLMLHKAADAIENGEHLKEAHHG